MGEIPTLDYEPGGDCSCCFGEGKTFNDVNTPKTIIAVFSGIVACPEGGEAGNGIYTLTQDDVDKCYYLGGRCSFCFSQDLGAGNVAWVYLAASLPPAACFTAEAVKCSTSFVNANIFDYCEAGFAKGYGGTCEIYWGPEI